jgi:phage terminase large subunit GpA-like protein
MDPETPVPSWLQTRRTALALRRMAWRLWAPPKQQSTRDWADECLYLSAEAGTARPGKYRSDVTPWIHEMQDAVDDPAVQEVVCMKSSQIAWTVGVIMAHIFKRIDIDPCAMVIMFPTTDSGRDFNDEKLVPTIDITPRIRAKIDLRSRKAGNRAMRKKFLGGFLKLVGSNSPRSVKSSSAPLLIVEEPDDASQDVKGQGSSIQLLKDRAKTYPRFKVIYGGTPTLKDFSAIEYAYLKSDQRKLFVPCHLCGAEHVLDWANVKWGEDPAGQRHEIYGHALPDSARYECPHCIQPWNDYEKNQNVQKAVWRATALFNGVAGFGYISELYVPWPKSFMKYLARRFLEAKRKAEDGDDSDLVAFYNSTLGLPYEYGGRALDVEALRKQCTEGQTYAEGTVPAPGLVLTAFVDVQHDRFAILVRAWGRGEESWMVKAEEIYGHINDRANAVWQELEQIVFGPMRHARGRDLFVSALGIDSGDGNTSDAVYDWVRAMKRKYRRTHIMATKGDSYRNLDKEIFSLPKQSVDHKTTTKAWKYGLRPFIIGTNKAKDLLLGGEQQRGRIHLTGNGPGRFHVGAWVREDYWDQLTAEVKAPSRRLRGKMIWQKRAGRNNEFLDCEVGNVHAARALKLHVLNPAQWDALERRLMQADLFQEPVAETNTPSDQSPAQPGAPAESAAGASGESAPAVTAPQAPVTKRRQISRGFVNRWRNS